MTERIRSHRELEVFQKAMRVAMEIYELSKGFPAGEQYSLTDQIRRSSRSVCATLAEGWRKRRYEAAFISKLSDADAEAEAAESQVWLELAAECGHLQREQAIDLYKSYDHIIATLVGMITPPPPHLVTPSSSEVFHACS